MHKSKLPPAEEGRHAGETEHVSDLDIHLRSPAMSVLTKITIA